MRFFPGGFYDETYIEWERGYKWQAHERWMERLEPHAYRELLDRRRFAEITEHAVRVESRTNLLFSFEKMALRDAVRSGAGAKRFAEGLYAFLHGPSDASRRARVRRRVCLHLATELGDVRELAQLCRARAARRPRSAAP